ncbi:hypothetical protein L6R49_27460, partial [Myxococcota bacterium]|nr:hypothetical protein [Myxococcota bacterium]
PVEPPVAAPPVVAPPVVAPPTPPVVEPEPAAQPMTNPAQAPAALLISSNSRGVVYIDRVKRGSVKPGEPLRVDVQTGRLEVRFVRSGGNARTEVVNVSEGDVFELKF